jgi:tetratricopeptide (TPR) repeat protein
VRNPAPIAALVLAVAVLPALIPGEAAAQQAAGGEAVRLYEQGLARQLAEDYTGAIDAYRASLRVNPAYVLPMVGLAESFHALGEQDEALKWVAQARLGDRRNLELAVLEARIRASRGELGAARALLESVLSQAPNDVQARIARARVEIADGNRREAVLQLEQAASVQPDNPEVLLELSQAYEALGQPERADPLLRRAVERYSEDPRIHLAAGRDLLERGDLEGARRSLERALAIRPGYAAALIALAETYLAAGRPRDAAESAKQALASTDAGLRNAARYLEGVAAARLPDPAEALRNFAEAIRLSPDDEVVRITAENLALRQPKVNDAFRRDLARYHFREGQRLEERNLLALALTELRRALRRTPRCTGCAAFPSARSTS